MATKKLKKPTKAKRSAIVKKLDAEFSKYIRLMNADCFGEVACVTCGAVKLWTEMQNGHFYSRSRYTTRWDPDNCHPQCVGCNVFKKGNYIAYTKWMLDRYGRKAVDKLEQKSLLLEKITTCELEDMLQFYKLEVIRLTKEV